MKLRGYQGRALKESIAALRGGGGFLLTLEMRTGKTIVSIRCAKHFEQYPILIVCPKVAIPVWRKIVAAEGLRLVSRIIHYEAVARNRKAWYKWADENRGFFMILDEAHFIKSRGSDRSRVVRTLAKRAKYRLALTGTPISEGLQDAWALYSYLNPSIFGPWDDTWEGGLDGHLIPGFESTYLRYGGFRDHEIVGYRNEEEFNRIFHKHQFRITLREAKEEGGKDPMVLRYRKRFFGLDRVPREVYDTLEEELETIVNQKKIKVPNVLSCVSKLQQIVGGFIIEKVPTGKYSKRSGKPIYKKIVHSIPGRGKLDLLAKEILDIEGKFIVICRFVHELEHVRDFLESVGYKASIVRGGMPYDGEFKDDAICMQIQSGMAVDMSKANEVIFYSLDYSFINFEQSRFRILSYDKSFGRYTFLLAKDTVDEVIYAAIRNKKRVADLVIDKYRRRKRRKETSSKKDGKNQRLLGMERSNIKRVWSSSFLRNRSG